MLMQCANTTSGEKLFVISVFIHRIRVSKITNPIIVDVGQLSFKV
jgi:hypothetical protein